MQRVSNSEPWWRFGYLGWLLQLTILLIDRSVFRLTLEVVEIVVLNYDHSQSFQPIRIANTISKMN